MSLIQFQDLKDMSAAVDVPIPDSNTHVRMHRLHTWDNGTSVMIVDFPPGWSRPFSGSYVCAEEFLVFEGELHMSGDVIVAGDHTWVPPNSLREGAFTPKGAHALAWFYGAPDWVRSIDEAGKISQIRTHINDVESGPIRHEGANGIVGKTLKVSPGEYHVEQKCEIINIIERTWSLHSPGEVLNLSGQEIVRFSE